MLVFYSGWGYDVQYYKDKYHAPCRSWPMYKQGLFELPESAEIDLRYKGETYTNILFESKLKHPDIIKTYSSNPEDFNGGVQFHLCEEWEESADDEMENPRISKLVKFTLADIVDITKDNKVVKSPAPIINKQVKTRIDNLKRAIDAAIIALGKKPSLDELWQYFQSGKDETGYIEDYTDEKITWIDMKGRPKDTQKSSLANRLSRIKL